MGVRLRATCLDRLHRHDRVRPQGRPLGIRAVVSSINSQGTVRPRLRILRNRAGMVAPDTADTVNSLLRRVVVNGVRVRRHLGKVMEEVRDTEDSRLSRHKVDRTDIRGRRQDNSRLVGINFLEGIIGGRNGCAGN